MPLLEARDPANHMRAMTPHAQVIVERYRQLDALLAQRGFPPTSAWWLRTIERWYGSAKRQCVVRCGRRGGKSSTLSRLGVVEALFGHHHIPPGDTGVVAIVSTNRDEAAKRIATVRAILDAIGYAYKPWGTDGLLLDGKPIGFKVYTASISGVSGFTGVFVFCDEVAKWKDSDTGVNPATEVLKSIRPTMLTQPHSKMVLSSSPMGQWDAHYDAFEEGETSLQITAYAPTWEANPSVTEEETKALEPDVATWEREYKAVPQAEVAESLFTSTELDASTRPAPISVKREPGVEYAAAMDPATAGNAWTLAVGAMRHTDRGLRKSLVHAQEWRGSSKQPLSPKATLKEISEVLGKYGVDILYTDQASGHALRDIADDFGITLVIDPWTHLNKLEAYKNLQTFVRTEQVELAPVAHVKQDLLGVRRKVTRSSVTIDLLKTPDGRHSDFAPSIAKLFSLPLSPPTERLHLAGSEADRRAQRRVEYAKKLEAEKQQASLGRAQHSTDRGPNASWRRGN